MKERTKERGGQTARKHNVFVDAVEWRRNRNPASTSKKLSSKRVPQMKSSWQPCQYSFNVINEPFTST